MILSSIPTNTLAMTKSFSPITANPISDFDILRWGTKILPPKKEIVKKINFPEKSDCIFKYHVEMRKMKKIERKMKQQNRLF